MFRDRKHQHATTTHRRRRTARPANVIAGCVGILAIALGVWALIKTGLNTDHIFTPTEDVLGLPHTPALALAEIGFGIVLLFAAATGAFGTFLIAVLGVASVVFGVIVVSDSWSGRVHRWTAASHDTGWIFILIGVVFVLAAVLPMLASSRTMQTKDSTPEAEAVPPQESDAVPQHVDQEPRSEPANAASETGTDIDAVDGDATRDTTTGARATRDETPVL